MNTPRASRTPAPNDLANRARRALLHLGQTLESLEELKQEPQHPEGSATGIVARAYCRNLFTAIAQARVIIDHIAREVARTHAQRPTPDPTPDPTPTRPAPGDGDRTEGQEPEGGGSVSTEARPDTEGLPASSLSAEARRLLGQISSQVEETQRRTDTVTDLARKLVRENRRLKRKVNRLLRLLKQERERSSGAMDPQAKGGTAGEGGAADEGVIAPRWPAPPHALRFLGGTTGDEPWSRSLPPIDLWLAFDPKSADHDYAVIAQGEQGNSLGRLGLTSSLWTREVLLHGLRRYPLSPVPPWVLALNLLQKANAPEPHPAWKGPPTASAVFLGKAAIRVTDPPGQHIEFWSDMKTSSVWLRDPVTGTETRWSEERLLSVCDQDLFSWTREAIRLLRRSGLATVKP
jgi:hypothetical protein